jgi:hypothetical protein
MTYGSVFFKKGNPEMFRVLDFYSLNLKAATSKGRVVLKENIPHEFYARAAAGQI